MQTISLKLPDALLRKLELAAKERRQSRSGVIRSALDQYLNSHAAAPHGSFLEAAGDLIGCVDGPGDLATNPKYMEGFGK
jgi:hypothetical protein